MATIRLVPSSNSVSSSTRVTVTSPTNMYMNTDDTSSYCTLRGRNQNSTTAYYAFISGFNFSSVPSNAIVSSFSVKIRCYRSSNQRTGADYYLRLCSSASTSSVISGTTASTDIGTSQSVITIPTGNLTWSTLSGYGSNFCIEVPLSSNSSSYPYVYVYGAEIEVTYALPIYHDVTASSSVSGVTVTPASQTVLEGNSATIDITSNGGSFTVKDNNVDVTNQLVQLQPTGSNTIVPSGYTNLSSGVTINSSYPIGNSYDNADDSTDYTRLDYNTSTTGYIELTFSMPSIPSSATLTGVSARARLRISSTSRMTNRICQLYNGSTAKGSNTDYSSTTSGGTVVNLSTGSWTVSELSNLRMRIGATSSSSTSSKYIYIYGADVTISYTLAGEAYTYTITNITTDHTIVISGGTVIPVTGVSLNKATDTVQIDGTTQLTATVAPSNATNQAVSWSSNATSVATVNSSGLVTAISSGTATITVTTSDGNFTATCIITVPQPSYTTYKLATSVQVGKSYLIANGNSGTVYLLSNESGGSRMLKGIATTVTDGKINITSSTEAKTLFSVNLTVAGNNVTTGWSINGQYLYCDNASGLRMNTVATLDRFWHWNNNKFWQFKSTASDGYSDTSSEYKYYLTLSGTNFTDSHVDTAGIENSDIPAIYLFVEDDGSSDESLYLKVNGSYVEATAVYKKINGAWVEQSDLTNVFDSNTNYLMG